MHRIFLAFLIVMALAACQTGKGGPAAHHQGKGKSGGKYPYGKKVAGKDGLVYSPYTTSDVYIDVRGFERGTEVKDPWTGKIFLVP